MNPRAERRLAELLLYVGRRPLRAGRVALAAIAWRADFEAYVRLGRPLTGPEPVEAAVYRKQDVPGRPFGWPRNPLRAALVGWRWGRVEHALRRGRLTRRDAEWVAHQWRDGVPV